MPPDCAVYHPGDNLSTVLLGIDTGPAGRTVVSRGAYTNGGDCVAAAYLRHGIDPVYCIHVHTTMPSGLREKVCRAMFW